jgi:hypothetical protein
MPFRKPQDPEAIERWKAVQRALKAQRKAAATPRLLALKKAAQERQREAYAKARERATALLRKYVRPAITTAGGAESVRPSPLTPKAPPSAPRENPTAKRTRTTSKAQSAQLSFASLTGKGE